MRPASEHGLSFRISKTMLVVYRLRFGVWGLYRGRVAPGSSEKLDVAVVAGCHSFGHSKTPNRTP